MTNFDGDETDTWRWGDSFIRIKWHSCYGDDIFYAVDLFEVSKITFSYRGNVVAEKVLSKFEIAAILSITKRIKIQISFDKDEEKFATDPDVPCQLSIRTKNRYFYFLWHTSDAEFYRKDYSCLNELGLSIEKMIDVDFSKLELPIYI